MLAQLDGYNLMHEGAKALAVVQHNGIRIDVDYLRSAKKETEKKQNQIKKELQANKVYQHQLRRFGPKTNISSRNQLAVVLASDYGADIPKTEKGSLKLDESVLDTIDIPYCKMFVEYEKLNKLASTYIDGVLKEVCNGYLHPDFNLHLVKTFRSSSSAPNFQNIPIRNKEIAEIIRSAFIPRPGHVLLEVDYAALEFRVAACYYKDPAMVEYASDPDKDIHRDCAAEIYKVKRGQVNKQTRYCAKNKFVFPELYGDFYISCARACWDSISQLALMVEDVPMAEHLRMQGITKLGKLDSKVPPEPNTFEWHLKNVEKRFYQWFPVLERSQDRLWNDYRKTGKFDLMTGFEINGVFKRNFVLNCVIQGPAFHLLLWSLIEIVKWTTKNRTKTKVVGQIHDCLILDCHVGELQDVINLVEQVMTKQVKSHYDWVITPLDIEVEVAEENWFGKKQWVKKSGLWQAV